MNKDMVKYAVENIMHRKLRSSLTAISIIIGVMAIFALLSFGQGLESYIEEISEEMGTDKLIIQPRGFGPPGSSSIKLTEDDLEFIEKIQGVSRATGLRIENGQVYFKDDADFEFVYVMGHDVDENIDLFMDIMTVEVLEGRQLKEGDVLKAVVGFNYALESEIFKRPVKVGDKINVNNFKVDVVGRYEIIGNPDDDKNIYFTYEGIERIYGVTNKYDWIVAQASPGEDPSALAEKINDKIRREKGQKEGEEEFTVQTFEEAIEAFTNIIAGVKGVLVVIALISVFVAGVNIMNTMYTAVLERTKEIGVMKAIGARNSEIVSIFLLESGLLGLFGGLVGIFIGWMISAFAGVLTAGAGFSSLQPVFPWWLIAGCLLFAVLVGTLSGLPPSIQASKQKPVEALRYE